jgi:nucleolar protein 14
MAKIKNKKSKLADSYAMIRKQKLNKKTFSPFEVHVNKTKQNVLGRKGKASHGLPGITRTKAINKRKNTLLLEYKVKDKDNIFLDRRIGEKNSGMSEEDKAMARFAAERIKAHKKKNIFNLNDEEVLTHRGQSLIDIEKYDNPRSDEDDYSDNENKTGKLDKKFVEDAHFGGGILSKPNSEMSRKDVINQLITESKKRKAERQKIREQTIDLTEKLDSEWHDLIPLVSSSKKAKEIVEEKSKADDYDIALRTLKYEARGMPTDKLKSEEEIIMKEKLALEKLEEERLARMKGFSDEAEFQKKHKSADDLDDFKIERIIDEPSDNENDDDKTKLIKLCNAEVAKNNNKIDNKKSILDQESYNNKTEQGNKKIDEDTEKEIEEEIEEDDGTEENTEEESDNLSDLKASDSSDSEEEIENEENKNIKNVITNFKIEDKILHKNSQITTENNVKTMVNSRTSIREAIIDKARQELPYTFTVPTTYKELQTLIKDYSPDYQSVIIERIIKCNQSKQSNENKEKLSNLFSFLLQYLNDHALTNNVEELTKFFQIFDRLCPHLYDLTHANPEATKNYIRDLLKEKHRVFEEKIKTYPKLDTVRIIHFKFNIILNIFIYYKDFG